MTSVFKISKRFSSSDLSREFQYLPAKHNFLIIPLTPQIQHIKNSPPSPPPNCDSSISHTVNATDIHSPHHSSQKVGSHAESSAFSCLHRCSAMFSLPNISVFLPTPSFLSSFFLPSLPFFLSLT